MKFKRGDIVDWVGMHGEVIKDISNWKGVEDYPIWVEFKSPYAPIQSFTEEGLLNIHHTLPTLKLIRRPKVKRKFWMVISKEEVDNRFIGSTGLYEDKPDCKSADTQVIEIELEV